MKVLFLTHYSSLYGANRSLLALLDGISREKIEPYVVMPSNGPLEKELTDRHIKYSVIPFKNWMAKTRSKAPLRLLMNIFILPFLYQKVIKWNIDLIHTNSSVTPIGSWLAFISNLPHIWHIREFGWEDYQYKYDLGRSQFEYWLNQASHIITVSKSLQNKVLKNVDARSTVVYNGVISREKAESVYANNTSSKNKTVFGIIGLLSPAKGQEQAIKAFSKISKLYTNTELMIAGSGNKEYELYLQSLCIDLDIHEKVSFLGYVDDPFEFYQRIDVALICSKNEGMGRVTAEAMIAGKIIIGLDNAGTSELIENKKTGFLYNGRVNSLAKVMDSVVVCNDLTTISKNSRIEGMNKFLIEKYADSIIKIYKKIL